MVNGSHHGGFKDFITSGGLDGILKAHSLREEQRGYLKSGLVVIVKARKARLTLFVPILNIPAPIKDYLVNSLREAVAALSVQLEVEIAQMNDEERQSFLAMEQESWKGL